MAILIQMMMNSNRYLLDSVRRSRQKMIWPNWWKMPICTSVTISVCGLKREGAFDVVFHFGNVTICRVLVNTVQNMSFVNISVNNYVFETFLTIGSIQIALKIKHKKDTVAVVVEKRKLQVLVILLDSHLMIVMLLKLTRIDILNSFASNAKNDE